MFSATAEYALRAVVYLAQQTPNFCTTESISRETQIPAAYLSKVLQSLGSAGIVHSKRGIGGGVALLGKLQETNILDVVNAVDPIERIKKCPLGLPEHLHLCPLHRRMDLALSHVESALKATTLKELIRENRQRKNSCRFPGKESQKTEQGD